MHNNTLNDFFRSSSDFHNATTFEEAKAAHMKVVESLLKISPDNVKELIHDLYLSRKGINVRAYTAAIKFIHFDLTAFEYASALPKRDDMN